MTSLYEICKEQGIQFTSSGKIQVPEWVRHIKFDIGLSYSAPHSQVWIKKEEDTLVFGFEPNPESVRRITTPNNYKNDPNHGDVLDYKYVNKNIYIVPVALLDINATSVPFYITTVDEGCSSLYKPQSSLFNVKRVYEVPVFTLKDFFELLDFNTIPYIEYIKIDAQGADLQIVKGAGSFLSEKVVFVTAECETTQYEGCQENTDENLTKYMNSIGFKKISHLNCCDPTYINTKYLHLENTIFISQG